MNGKEYVVGRNLEEHRIMGHVWIERFGDITIACAGYLTPCRSIIQMKGDKKAYFFELEWRIAVAHGQRRYDEVEMELQNAYKEAEVAKDLEALREIFRLFAHLYILKQEHNEAEQCYTKLERLWPDSIAIKLDFATFYYYCLNDFRMVVQKLDEIKLDKEKEFYDAEFISYYPALNLKGQALLNLNETERAEGVLDELIAIAGYILNKGSRVFIELNFVERMIKSKIAIQKCKKYLLLIKDRIKQEDKVTLDILLKLISNIK